MQILQEVQAMVLTDFLSLLIIHDCTSVIFHRLIVLYINTTCLQEAAQASLLPELLSIQAVPAGWALCKLDLTERYMLQSLLHLARHPTLMSSTIQML